MYTRKWLSLKIHIQPWIVEKNVFNFDISIQAIETFIPRVLLFILKNVYEFECHSTANVEWCLFVILGSSKEYS